MHPASTPRKSGRATISLSAFTALPPLYYDQDEDKQTSSSKKVPLVVVSPTSKTKTPSAPWFSPQATFAPISEDRPADDTDSAFPPLSPSPYGKIPMQQLMSLQSPAPSMMSLSTSASDSPRTPVTFIDRPYCIPTSVIYEKQDRNDQGQLEVPASPPVTPTSGRSYSQATSDGKSLVRSPTSSFSPYHLQSRGLQKLQQHPSPTTSPGVLHSTATNNSNDPYLSPVPTRSTVSPGTTAFYSARSSFSPPSPIATKLLSSPITPTKSPRKKSSASRGGGDNHPLTPRSSSSTKDHKQRVKTELCMHYLKNERCPFGANCTYAHGEEELQMTKLMDLYRAGLIDNVDTYRTKICWTWVATGSCPFGKRCSCIHDPRVMGSTPSWLTHTETQGNSICTDINVDGLHQKRLQTVLCNNPFGDQFSLELDGWTDLYNLVCNTSASTITGGPSSTTMKTKAPRKTKKRNKEAAATFMDRGGRRSGNPYQDRIPLTESHKLSIALQMRGDSSEWMYKFRPQHVIFDTVCMILQVRHFRLETSSASTGAAGGDSFDHMATPIKNYQFNVRNPNHVKVHEIAFGPDCDPTAVRGVALWFHLPDSDMKACTPTQAKRFRWKKPNDRRKPDNVNRVLFGFDAKDSFAMIRPLDQDAFQLTTDILQHRYDTVQAERLTELSKRFPVMNALKEEAVLLEERFHNHKKAWIKWAWKSSIDEGGQMSRTVDDFTPVPLVDTHYNPIIEDDDDDVSVESDVGQQTEEERAVMGSAVRNIWSSFLKDCFQFQADDAATKEEDKVDAPSFRRGGSSGGTTLDPEATNPARRRRRRRLSIFAKLGCGFKVCPPSRSLPHILFNRYDSPTARAGRLSKNEEDVNDKKRGTSASRRQSDRCWQSLLLPVENNEWEVVRDHFENVRSKKVLTIIQSPTKA